MPIESRMKSSVPMARDDRLKALLSARGSFELEAEIARGKIQRIADDEELDDGAVPVSRSASRTALPESFM